MPLRLESERLILTPQVPADAPWLAELFTARGAGAVDVAAALTKIEAMQSLVAELGIGARVLHRREDGEPLGYCAIVIGRGSVDEPELAYELLPSAHGKGYATEAARVVLDAALATGRQRIWSTVRPWNTPSLRVLEKLGFSLDHTTSDERGEILWWLRER